MTASEVLGSITTYCHVDVAFSKNVKTVGVSASELGCRRQGSAGGILLTLVREARPRAGADDADPVAAGKSLGVFRTTDGSKPCDGTAWVWTERGRACAADTRTDAVRLANLYMVYFGEDRKGHERREIRAVNMRLTTYPEGPGFISRQRRARLRG